MGRATCCRRHPRLAAVGILVLRITISDVAENTYNELLRDRFDFDSTPFTRRLDDATEVWVFAPSAINVLSAQNCDALRGRILSKPGGVLHVVILDPEDSRATQLAIRQLDDSVDYPIQDFRDSQQTVVRQLRAMSNWCNEGSFEYRFLEYNPGFSLVAINPNARNGHIIVEFHGFHNVATSSRMHIEISHQDSDQWFAYWVDQFNQIWQSSSVPQ